MRFINAVICTIGVLLALFGLAGIILAGMLSSIINITGTWSAYLFIIVGIGLFWWGNHRDERWSREKHVYVHYPHHRGHQRYRYHRHRRR